MSTRSGLLTVGVLGIVVLVLFTYRLFGSRLDRARVAGDVKRPALAAAGEQKDQEHCSECCGFHGIDRFGRSVDYRDPTNRGTVTLIQTTGTVTITTSTALKRR